MVSEPGVNGFLYDPKRPEEAASIIKSLLQSKPLREKVADAGRKEVERWSWRNAVGKVTLESLSVVV